MKSDDKRYAASNYIITFYKEVEQLTHNSGVYRNLLVEIENKYGKDAVSKLEEQSKQVILEILQLIRLGVHKSFIQYNSIKDATKIKFNDKIVETYNKIDKQFIINFEDLKNYVIEINSVLVNDIIQDLLNTSNDLLENMFKDEK